MLLLVAQLGVQKLCTQTFSFWLFQAFYFKLYMETRGDMFITEVNTFIMILTICMGKSVTLHAP